MSNYNAFKRDSRGLLIDLTKVFTMKVLIFTLFLLSFAAHAEVDCYGSALDNYSKDSNSFQIYAEEVSEGFENKDRAASTQAIKLLEQKLNCREGAFSINSISCKEIIPGHLHSKVCYLESQRGFFFVSIDMMEQVNITFSRWD